MLGRSTSQTSITEIDYLGTTVADACGSRYERKNWQDGSYYMTQVTEVRCHCL
jgi:hypothetical protein